jgi:hypothetical protein
MTDHFKTIGDALRYIYRGAMRHHTGQWPGVVAYHKALTALVALEMEQGKVRAAQEIKEELARLENILGKAGDNHEIVGAIAGLEFALGEDDMTVMDWDEFKDEA